MRGRWSRVTPAALLVAAVLCAPAQSPPASRDAAGQPKAAGGEGYVTTIQVHGDWTVVVRNADGSVASTHRFENSIASGGRSFFSRLMGRTAGQFYWGVRLDSLCGSATILSACVIAEPASAGDSILSSFFQGNVISNLTIATPTTGPDAYKFVMRGSMTSQYAAQITRVETITVVPLGTTDNILSVTGTDLQQPIQVQAGQSVDVTVVIACS